MQRIRAWIISFFGFSRSETNGFLILLPLMAIIMFSAPVYRWWWAGRPLEQPNDQRLDSLIATWKWDKQDSASETPHSAVSFDPNTASLAALKNLGFSDKLSRQLTNYRTRGGKFRIKRDLGRLYGMDSSLMNKLYSYIDLPEKMISVKPFHNQRHTPPVQSTRFDLNMADTSQLISIYGIGPKLATRILKYRDRLNGFVSMNQLREVYGLDSVVIDQLKKRTFIRDDFRPRPINVNTADEKQLASLPYIKFRLANSIAAYRFQHGDFASVEELLKLALVDETLFQKIKPYLTIKD
jgi:competence protein ComEA